MKLRTVGLVLLAALLAPLLWFLPGLLMLGPLIGLSWLIDSPAVQAVPAGMWVFLAIVGAFFFGRKVAREEIREKMGDEMYNRIVKGAR